MSEKWTLCGGVFLGITIAATAGLVKQRYLQNRKGGSEKPAIVESSVEYDMVHLRLQRPCLVCKEKAWAKRLYSNPIAPDAWGFDLYIQNRGITTLFECGRGHVFKAVVSGWGESVLIEDARTTEERERDGAIEKRIETLEKEMGRGSR